MTTKELELFNEFHMLARKACVGYTIHHDEACHTYDITIKSISLFERFHTSASIGLDEVLTQAINHLNKIAYPNHSPGVHLVM